MSMQWTDSAPVARKSASRFSRFIVSALGVEATPGEAWNRLPGEAWNKVDTRGTGWNRLDTRGTGWNKVDTRGTGWNRTAEKVA